VEIQEMNIKNDYGKFFGDQNDVNERRDEGKMGNTSISLNFNEKLMRIYGYYVKSL
jgi:hypothetical protein